MQNSPLVDIQEFLLALFMSRAGDLGRDEVRELARKHWIALTGYLKGDAEPEPEPVEPQPPLVPAVRKERRDHGVRNRFQPRHRIA